MSTVSSSSVNRASLRVAVLGAGTVGGEVIRAFIERPGSLAPADGAALVLARVADKFLTRARGLGVAEELLTESAAEAVASPDVDVVVELMGGDEPARTLILAALAAGKAVVTANKHVIAHHGPELEAAARAAGAPLRFEAAVGGGIPILGPLAAELAANRVDGIRGIVNGTTNYILSAMSDAGRPYAAVLADAKARGFAEADPTGDVEGDDAVNKVVILARLAFGAWLDPASVDRRPPTVDGLGLPGITGVTAADVAAAAAVGLTLKLVASTRRQADGSVVATVLPTAVPSSSPLGRTSGVVNRVEIDADPVGRVAMVGLGAGGGPTSSAILGDLIAIARGEGSTWAGLAPATDATVAAATDGGPCRRFFSSTLPDQLVRDQQLAIEKARKGAFITAARPLDELKAGLAAAGIEATLYPMAD